MDKISVRASRVYSLRNLTSPVRTSTTVEMCFLTSSKTARIGLKQRVSGVETWRHSKTLNLESERWGKVFVLGELFGFRAFLRVSSKDSFHGRRMCLKWWNLGRYVKLKIMDSRGAKLPPPKHPPFGSITPLMKFISVTSPQDFFLSSISSQIFEFRSLT